MAFPFFALVKNAWIKLLTYQTDIASIGVRPSASDVATIYDKEILCYIANLMAAKIEGGEGEDGFFLWLSEAKLHYSCAKGGERRPMAVRVLLCNWLFRATSQMRRSIGPSWKYAAADAIPDYRLDLIENAAEATPRPSGRDLGAGGADAAAAAGRWRIRCRIATRLGCSVPASGGSGRR